MPPKTPERVFGGMAEQKNRPQKQRNARGLAAPGVVGTILPSDLAIPCWVAPLQSPTPFRQTTSSVTSKTCFGAELPSAREVQNRHKRLPGLAAENRHQAPTGSKPERSTLSRSTNRNRWYNRSLTPTHHQPTVGFEALRECRFSSAARHCGTPRMRNRSVSTSITLSAVKLRPSSSATHSRVYSSTIESHFNGRPLVVRS